MNKKTGLGTAFLCVVIIAVMGVVFFYLKDCELYIGGVILRNVHTMVGILFEIFMFIIVIIVSSKNLKKISDEKERKKTKGYIVGISVLTLFFLGFTFQLIAEYVEQSRKAAIAETDIGEGQSLLLVENEEKFSSDGESFYEITVYCRKGLKLKKIGRQIEYYFLHDNMVRNGQYRVERKGDTVTVHYDYGELTNGMKWKDEYKDNPPAYIDKEYNLK